MKFNFNKCFSNQGKEINGLFEVTPIVYKDSRGEFLEVYNKKEFFNANLNMNFVQDNQSQSVKGVLRGLHFQTKHPQGKLIRCVLGTFFDVAVDLRKGSETFGQYCGKILDDKKKNQFYIPEGFAHGFYVLSEIAICSYKCTDFYEPDGESGLMWNDPKIGINWPIENDMKKILAEKDLKYPDFDISKDYFDINGKWIGK